MAIIPFCAKPVWPIIPSLPVHTVTGVVYVSSNEALKMTLRACYNAMCAFCNGVKAVFAFLAQDMQLPLPRNFVWHEKAQAVSAEQLSVANEWFLKNFVNHG